MLRNLILWCRRHFGGRMDYHSAVEAGKGSYMYFMETSDTIVVSYKGALYPFTTAMPYELLAVGLHLRTRGDDNIPLNSLSPADFDHIQRREGAALYTARISDVNLRKLTTKLMNQP